MEDEGNERCRKREQSRGKSKERKRNSAMWCIFSALFHAHREAGERAVLCWEMQREPGVQGEVSG